MKYNSNSKKLCGHLARLLSFVASKQLDFSNQIIKKVLEGKKAL